MIDKINPTHYNNGPFEAIELCRLMTFNWGNVAKYAYRWQEKNGVEDLEKAIWYATDAYIREIPIWADEDNFSFGIPLLKTLSKMNYAGLKDLWQALSVGSINLIVPILKKKISDMQTAKTKRGCEMMEDEIKTVWLESIDHYGKEKQSIVCMEECAELIQAISKRLRGKPDLNNNLTEEMADVTICLNLLKEMYGVKDCEIHEWVRRKTIRQAGRMSSETKSEDAE